VYQVWLKSLQAFQSYARTYTQTSIFIDIDIEIEEEGNSGYTGDMPQSMKPCKSIQRSCRLQAQGSVPSNVMGLLVTKVTLQHGFLQVEALLWSPTNP
jgi:polyphosphate kinase